MVVPPGNDSIGWFEGAGSQWIAFEKTTGLVRGELIPTFKKSDHPPPEAPMREASKAVSQQQKVNEKAPTDVQQIPPDQRTLPQKAPQKPSTGVRQSGLDPRKFKPSTVVDKRTSDFFEQRQKNLQHGKTDDTATGVSLKAAHFDGKQVRPKPQAFPQQIGRKYTAWNPNAPPFDWFTQRGQVPLDEDEDIVWEFYNEWYYASRLSTLEHDPSAKPKLMTQRISFWVIPNAKRRLASVKRRRTADRNTQWGTPVAAVKANDHAKQQQDKKQNQEQPASAGSNEPRSEVHGVEKANKTVTALDLWEAQLSTGIHQASNSSLLTTSQREITTPAMIGSDSGTRLHITGSASSPNKRKAYHDREIRRPASPKKQRLAASVVADAAHAAPSAASIIDGTVWTRRLDLDPPMR